MKINLSPQMSIFTGVLAEEQNTTLRQPSLRQYQFARAILNVYCVTDLAYQILRLILNASIHPKK